MNLIFIAQSLHASLKMSGNGTTEATSVNRGAKRMKGVEKEDENGGE